MNTWVRIALQAVLYLALQVFLADDFAIQHFALAHLYLGFLVFLPLDAPRFAAYTVVFLWAVAYGAFQQEWLGGLVVAITLTTAIRTTWARLITSPSVFSDTGGVDFGRQPFSWVLLYMLPLILLHELILLPLVNLSLSWKILAQVFTTALYSGTLLLGVYVLFYRKRK